MRYAIYTILGLITLGMISTAVLSQELYRPTLKTTVPLGLFCITSDQINMLSKLFGFSWARDINTMTLVYGMEKIEVEFTGDCATSAKVIQ
jgi:hypothetical protein